MIHQTHPASRRRAAMLVLAGSLVVAACSSGSSAETTTTADSAAPRSDPSTTVESSVASSPSDPTTTTGPTTTAVSSTTTTTTTTTPSLEIADDELATLGEQWTSLWTAASLAEADKDAAIQGLGGLLTPNLIDPVAGLFDGSEMRSIENNAVITQNEDGSVSINDCVYVLPPQESISNWYEARAVLDESSGWSIVAIEQRTTNGCIPQTVAEAALADYREFWDARTEYWNPADPNHPGVAGTMTGGERDRIVELLEQHQRDGWYVVNEGREVHPEILRVEAPNQVVVLDCQLASQNRGLFNAADERQQGINEATPDQRDIYEVTMILEDGQWKASDTQVVEGVPCEFAPTPRALPQV